MRLLELFAGTGSVGKVAKSLGWDVTILDLDFRTKPDIVADIMHWDYKAYAPGQFDMIWASPPCTEYSTAKTVGERDLNKADSIVKHLLHILHYLQPKFYIIENPQTGMLKDRPFMTDLPYRDIDYCKYGMPSANEQGYGTTSTAGSLETFANTIAQPRAARSTRR